MSSLSAEEQAVLESVELGEWQSIPDLSQAVVRYQRYAQRQGNALEAVSIEMTADDLQSF